MSSNYGPNVSRVLDPTGTQYTNIIWQQGRPPLDAEFSLGINLAMNVSQNATLRGTPSGWLGNETNTSAVFLTDPTYSNWFKFGNQLTGDTTTVTWANVNGWLIPVVGTRTGAPPKSFDNTSTWNKITLNPPGGVPSVAPVEFVFLEVWLARIPASPISTNKPSPSQIYQFGNVEGGMQYLPEDLVDPAMGMETTERVQLQYRICVVSSQVNLTLYPDGFDPAYVFAQGAASTATTFTFTNMRQTLGDPGLWRAGDGNSTTSPLATVDGYVYAIPLTAVFRRNVVAWNGHPSPNLNGGFDRNPTAHDRTGATTFSTVPTLATAMQPDGMTFTLVSATNIPLPAVPSLGSVTVRIGNELLQYSQIMGTLVTVTHRGVLGTVPEYHAVGATVEVVSGRPDGLFADQITKADILDLRHVVNPNGFDYTSLLKYNLDKLLRGQLRTTWKATGAAGVQGINVPYQDYISRTAPTGLGVTQLDLPDGFRQVWSDAAVPQRVLAVIQPVGQIYPAISPAISPVSVTGDLTLTANQLMAPSSAANTFNPGDTITIPIIQFRSTVTTQDDDQIRFLYDGDPTTVSLRIDGYPGEVPTSWYRVTTTGPGSDGDLVITFWDDFPSGLKKNIYITFHLLYGPGRGLSRRPLALNNLSYYRPGTSTLVQTENAVAGNHPLRTAYAPLWAKYTNTVINGTLPVTAESYADLGSKTVILTPFRKIKGPVSNGGQSSSFGTYDGNALWSTPTQVIRGDTGCTPTSAQFTDTGNDFASVLPGMQLVITSADPPDVHGTYTVLSVAAHTLTLSEPIGTHATADLHYTVQPGSTIPGCGLMPWRKADGVTAKWLTTDPLNVFSGCTDPVLARKNIYAIIPKHLAPSWGEVRVPIIGQALEPTIYEGVNFLFNSPKGAPPYTPDTQDYVAYTGTGGGASYAVFTTLNLNDLTPAIYNSTTTWGGKTLCGVKHFDDNATGSPIARKMGRHGLQLPPFYGIARLFAVYAALDYRVNSSAYDESTRNRNPAPVPPANLGTNLLRQNFDGPTFWIEKDDDGDSYFILNADALDLTRVPAAYAIADFDTGNFVIEASIFGFDREAFDLDKECRIVLTRERTECNSIIDRTVNLTFLTGLLTSPTFIIPAPPQTNDTILINYTRTPYQGNPWGTTLSGNLDLGYYCGPLSSLDAYTIANTPLDPNTLTMPNQKPLEVLASVGFATTLGTGRMSGFVCTSSRAMLSNIGAENIWAYPPVAPDSLRPAIISGVLGPNVTGALDDTSAVATEYLGCTERLPLGALMRDKDFHGGFVGPYDQHATLTFTNSTYGCYGIGLARSATLEGKAVPLDCASPASGQPGEVLVQVDGTNITTSTTNFKTFRGGSLFRANGGHPGGELYCTEGTIGSSGLEPEVLVGKAMLVRNTVTVSSTTQVSAGTELMLLIATTANRCLSGNQQAWVELGTNGTGEGISASELYRLEGHPLLRDNVQANIDPTTIKLSPRLTVQR